MLNEYSLQFNGTNAYGRMDYDFSTHSEFTVLANIYVEGLSARNYIIESTPNYAAIAFEVSAGYLKAWITNSATTQDRNITSNILMPTNRWVTVAATWKENDTLQIYQDGEMVGSVSIAGVTIGKNQNGVNIGTYRSANGRWFNGKIDNISMWNRRLSDKDIAYYSNLRLNVDNEPNLTFYAKFDEGTGNITIDEVSKKNISLFNTSWSEQTPELRYEKLLFSNEPNTVFSLGGRETLIVIRDNIVESDFINYGFTPRNQTTDVMLANITMKKKNGIILGSGKTFTHTIDLNKHRINSIKL